MEQQIDNRRDSFRMSYPESREEAKLRVGNKLIACEVLDESAGGFLIEGKKFPATPSNQPVELHTISGRHPLRVVWRRLTDGNVRIGLQRLPDEFLWQQDSSWVIWMIFAIIVGFGGGYVFAFRDQPLTKTQIMDQIAEISGRNVSNSYVEEPSDEPVTEAESADQPPREE